MKILKLKVVHYGICVYVNDFPKYCYEFDSQNINNSFYEPFSKVFYEEVMKESPERLTIKLGTNTYTCEINRLKNGYLGNFIGPRKTPIEFISLYGTFPYERPIELFIIRFLKVLINESSFDLNKIGEEKTYTFEVN